MGNFHHDYYSQDLLQQPVQGLLTPITQLLGTFFSVQMMGLLGKAFVYCLCSAVLRLVYSRYASVIVMIGLCLDVYVVDILGVTTDALVLRYSVALAALLTPVGMLFRRGARQRSERERLLSDIRKVVREVVREELAALDAEHRAKRSHGAASSTHSMPQQMRRRGVFW
mmetsp:Transcript_22730/g.49783  ORF Transcript_22730/g.49783 Transcript_22730/m.49783 type:complete len:169 (+) Transcript_22730:232-738(+)